MGHKYAFFMVLPLVAVSVIVGGHFWGGLGLLGLTLGRILALRNWKVALMAVIAVGGFSGYLLGREQQINRRQLPIDANQTVNVALRIQPDAVVLRGAAYYLVAQNVQTGEWMSVRGYAKSAVELHALQRLQQPQIWQVAGQQQGILPATNVNQFDAAAYWRHRGIVKSLKITTVNQRSPATSHWYQWFNDWWHVRRAQLIQYCDQLPGALRIYALGLFPGSRAAETANELQGMQQLGLLHLFAISGLHVALLLTALEWVCVHLKIPREHWEWLTLLSLPGYFILAGSNSGVLRACLMRGSQLASKKLGSQVDTLTAWSWALFVGLLINPGLVFELGSQLSYGLSLGLIFLTQETHWWRQIGLTLLGLPSLLNGVYQWHGLTLLANWLIVPLFPVVILPITIVGTLSFLWLPGLSHACAFLLEQLDHGLRLVGSWPGNILFGKPWWGFCWLWWGSAWWLFSKPVAQRRRWLLGLLASYGLAFGVIHLPLHGEVTYFDVGQGDSILIREPFNRRVTLIDTGGHLSFAQPKWVPKTVPTYAATQTNINYLKSRGISHIDDLYLSHHDADHIGDLPAILQAFRVERILVPAGMETETGWQHLLRGVRQSPPVVPITVGLQPRLQVRHPFTAAPAENGQSTVLQGSFGGLNFLFMGDLDQAGERAMLSADVHLRTDVLKLGHHGSKTATAPDFVAQIQPRLAIISAGRQSRYGHPHEETLTTLRQAQVPAISTQTSGMIRYVYAGDHGYWQTKLKGVVKQ